MTARKLEREFQLERDPHSTSDGHSGSGDAVAVHVDGDSGSMSGDANSIGFWGSRIEAAQRPSKSAKELEPTSIQSALLLEMGHERPLVWVYMFLFEPLCGMLNRLTAWRKIDEFDLDLVTSILEHIEIDSADILA